MDAAKKSILIIEDEKDMANLVSQVLKREGYTVDTANDGEEGLNKVLNTKPDMVILDIALPKLDGRDLLSRIKKNDSVKCIPVIILSGKTEQWDRETGLKLGADEYIDKPLEVVKLLRQIKNLFKKKEEQK